MLNISQIHDGRSNITSFPGNLKWRPDCFPAFRTPFPNLAATKAKPFILQKVYQRSNYGIKWGGVQNSLNDK